MTIAVIAFEAEKMQAGVSGLVGDLWHVLGVVGAVAPGVADRAVDHHLALAAHAERQARVDAVR